MATFKITIERSVKEIYEMELEASEAMVAFDQARQMVKARNQTSAVGTYSVIKVENMEK